MKQITRLVSGVLFVISAALFMAAVYSAATGELLDLTAYEFRGLEPGAVVVAVVVTITWINGGLMLKHRAVDGALEWKVTRALTVLAFCVDVLIMLALIARLHIPPLLPLFVAMGHAGAHVFIWIAASGEMEKRPGGLLNDAYKSTEELLTEMQQQLVKLQQDNIMLQAEIQHKDRMHEATTQQAQRMLEDANRVYTATCEGCNRVFEGKTQDLANKGMYGHTPHCKRGISLPPNGHKAREAVN